MRVELTVKLARRALSMVPFGLCTCKTTFFPFVLAANVWEVRDDDDNVRKLSMMISRSMNRSHSPAQNEDGSE